MTGKEKCELLKAIRKNIAEMNGIEYFPEQCDHEGNCPGFCPRCDMEASYLMKELRKKEAAGSPIRIDTESLGVFETLVSTSIDDHEEEILMGLPAPPELDGDIIPEHTMGIMPAPDDYLQGDVSDESDEDENESNEDSIDGQQFLEDNREAIDRMCRGCSRFDSIMATDKGVRCACLSEHFFLGMLEKKSCSLKR